MPVSLLVAAAIGLAAGFLSGQFGIGGGIITTPAIRLILGQPGLIAVGTPLPVIIPTALAGAWAYWRRGLVDVRVGLLTGLLGGVFAVVGALVSDVLGGTVVLVTTAALILWTAVDMIGGIIRPEKRVVDREVHLRRKRSWPWMIGLAAAAGLYSGLLGLGGGLIITPALTRFFGEDIKRAIGTSLAAVTVLAIPGTITHYYLGHVDVGIALALIVGVVPGALLGARLTIRAKDRNVRIGFAALLLVAGVALAATEIGLL